MEQFFLDILKLAIAAILGGFFGAFFHAVLQRKGYFLPPTPLSEQRASIYISGSPFVVDGGEEIRMSFKAKNVSSYTASNVQIYFQEYAENGWSMPGFLTCELATENEFIQIIKSMSMEKFIRELSSIIPLPNFEGLEVRAPIQYHFAIRVQWDNPNGTVGCILQYAKVAPYLYRTVHEDTNVAGYEFIVSNELPDELPPATLPPCPD